MGKAVQDPTLIGTDNSANLSIAMETATPSRIKLHLGRWAALKERVRRGVCTLGKIGTHVMPVDFLTKWLCKAKLEDAVAYLANSRNAVAPT